MTIVFKYGSRADPGNLPDTQISGIASWATVAIPYQLSKNYPDFMVFIVSSCRPRCPIDTTIPEVVPPGTKFPAYRLPRVVGGPNVVPIDGGTQDATQVDIPPHSEIWAVSGIFPPFATNPPPVHRNFSPTGPSPLIEFRGRNGLEGDLYYPTQQDITYFASLGFPTTNNKGPGTFLRTGFPNLDDDYTWIIQYQVSCSDFAGNIPPNPDPNFNGNSLPTYLGTVPIPTARLNQQFFLPYSWDQGASDNFVLDVLEESNIRKVIRIKNKQITSGPDAGYGQGFHIWTYYYKYFNSPTLTFSTRIHWSDRNPIPGATGLNKNPLVKRVHQILACTDSPIDIFAKEITMPKVFGTGGNVQHADFAEPTIDRTPGSERESRRPFLNPERATDGTAEQWSGPNGTRPNANRYPYPVTTPPFNPNYGNNNIPWGYAYKVFGDEEMGLNICIGPSSTISNPIPSNARYATSAIAVVTKRERWVREGFGHYFYGVLYGRSDVPGQEFTSRDYYILRQFGDFGMPEGTYIWAEGVCV